ncbi:helix-turn-helix transcriptional regulator [Shimazuella alba]|uniref:WYL domain-containing protein n=1 Tax=Shimazuella alba TaxID=2690964 RepID=A0A6I4VY05_9BACL|nr:YafY family protein [Shimazuella alba]MXQ54746.1 WYL domain-containing protein [Shimazuella alba]
MHKSQRLIQLMMVINAKKNVTVRELADEFGLSARTISRDLQDLSEIGFPIYSVQGRGGGYRLLQERMLPPIAFLESEAVAMFFAFQSLQYFGSLPFEDGMTSALLKFYHYLPDDVRRQIDRLQNKIVIWSPHRSMSSANLKTLLQAIMLQKVVTIRYSSAAEVTERDIQPIGIYASQGYWYCPAYCFLRKTYRLFRADRILFASLNESISFREDVDQRSVFDWDAPEKNRLEKITLVVNITSKGCKKIESNGWFDDTVDSNEDGSGTVRAVIPKKDLDFYVEMIWGLGQEAKIIEPVEAVNYIKQKIEMLRQQYV